MTEVTVHRSSTDEGIIEITDDGDIRSLYFGSDAKQSSMQLSAPNNLELTYTQTMMLALAFQSQPQNGLLIGLGGGSIAKFLHHHYPDIKIDAVELRPDVIKLAHAYFCLPECNRINTIIGDGYQFLSQDIEQRYDLIQVDAFNHNGIADEVKRDLFFHHCQEKLSGNGVLAVNLWTERRDHFSQTLAMIEAAFEGVVLSMPVTDRGNTIIFAANHKDVFKTGSSKDINQLEQRLGLELNPKLRQLKKHNRWRRLSALFV